MNLKDLAYSVAFKVNDKGIRDAEKHMSSFEKQSRKSFKTFESAASKANKTFDKFNDSLKDNELYTLGGTLQGIGKGMMKYITLPIVGAGTAAINFGTKYSGTMANVQAVTGATDDEINTLKDSIKGMDSLFNRIELGNVSEMFARSGISPEGIGAALQPVTDAATANKVDAELTASMSIEGSNIFKRDIKDSEEMLDLFSNTAAKSNSNLQGINETMVYAGPSFQNLGYTIEDFAFSTGLLANEGVHASMAGTGLRVALSNLAAPTTKGQKVMEKYGVSIRDASGEMREFPDMIDNLRQGFGGLAEDTQMAALTSIFGERGAAVMLKFVNTNQENIDKMQSATSDYLGATAEMKSIIEQSSEYKLQKLKTDSIDMLISGFEIMEPYFSVIVTGLSNVFKWITDLDPVSKTFIGVTLTGLALLGPAIWFVGGIMQSMAMIMIARNMGLFKSFIGVASSIWAAAAPLLPFIATALLVGYAAKKISDNWDELAEYFGRFTDWTGNKFEKAGEWIGNSLGNAADWVSGKWHKFIDWASSLPQKAKDKAGEMKDNILAKLSPVTDFFDVLMNKAYDVGWAMAHPIKAAKGKFKGDTIHELRLANEKEVKVIESAAQTYDGSHRAGANKIPHDNYKGNLHKGEMVLTSSTADKYRTMGGTKDSVPNIGNHTDENINTSNNYEEYNPENTTKTNNNNVTYNPIYSIEVKGGGNLGVETKRELERLIKRLQREGMEDFFYTLKLRTS